jgi:hypothetical protein
MEQPGAELASLLYRSGTWAARLYQFNYQLADYLHPSRRRDFTDILLTDEVWEKPRARQALSQHILACLGKNALTCFDLAHEEWPLLLLDAGQLDRLARHVAATLYNVRIARCIEQGELGQWKRLLGLDGYKFALHGTPLLPDMKLSEPDTQAADALAHAYALIDAAWSEAPGPLLARGRLKLPARILQTSADQGQARHLVFALLFILEPKWRSSFAEFRK